MKHTDVIKPQFIEEYEHFHKIIYRNLDMALMDMYFLESCLRVQDLDLGYNALPMKCLYRSVFSSLTMNVCKCFFDNSGNDATNLLIFKNRVIGKYLREEHVEHVTMEVSKLLLSNKDYKKKVSDIEKNVLILRDNFISHGLLKSSYDKAIVLLPDYHELLSCGCELFDRLSFEPETFYSAAVEGDGHIPFPDTDGFSKVYDEFLSYTLLASPFIKNVTCEVDPFCEEKIQRKLAAIEKKLNEYKQS